jgi:acetyl esterase
MALSRQTRIMIGVTNVLARLHLLPDPQRVVRQSVAKRAAVKAPRALVGKVPEDVEAIDSSIVSERHDIPIRIYRSTSGGPGPTVIYMHGGGWITGGIPACDAICRHIASAAPAVVVSVAYRLAPEFPYPAALEDALTAIEWVVAGADELCLDVGRLVVAGDSAGGNLAAAAALVHLSSDRHPLAAQVLIYPALDHTCSTPSSRNYTGPGLSVTDTAMCSRFYCGDADPADPLLSPLLAPEVSGMPNTLVLTAGYDCVHDEGVAYAARLADAGVPATHIDYPDYMHGFFSVPRLYSGMEQSWKDLTSFIASVPRVEVAH